MPLEQSNFAYMLGSSGVACSEANSFKEYVCENANTLAYVGTHMVVLVHFKKEVEFEG